MGGARVAIVLSPATVTTEWPVTRQGGAGCNIRFCFAICQVQFLICRCGFPNASSLACIILPRYERFEKAASDADGSGARTADLRVGARVGKPSVPVPLDLLKQKAKEILSPRAY